MEEIQSLNSYSVRAQVWVDLEHGTHLTINGSTSVKTDVTNYHAQETSHAREGIDLLNEQINPRLQGCTYCYGPI